MLARSINYAIPTALAVHYFACYYYFFNELAANKAKAIPLGTARGTGYILGAEDLKLLGASSQRMVPATSNLFREKPSVHFHISSCFLD